jgi:hypothetical protein
MSYRFTELSFPRLHSRGGKLETKVLCTSLPWVLSDRTVGGV